MEEIIKKLEFMETQLLELRAMTDELIKHERERQKKSKTDIEH